MILVNFEPKRSAGDVFRGRPAASGKKAVVTVNGNPLPLRLDLGKISLSGFNWGYAGAGPGQLALAVLAHAAGDEVARAEWDRFRQGFIKKLDMRQPFAFTASDVTAFLNGLPVDARQFIRPVRKQEKRAGGTSGNGCWKRRPEGESRRVRTESGFSEKGKSRLKALPCRIAKETWSKIGGRATLQPRKKAYEAVAPPHQNLAPGIPAAAAGHPALVALWRGALDGSVRAEAVA